MTLVKIDSGNALAIRMSHGHYNNTCPSCGVKSGCRCGSKDKVETTDLCQTCKNKKPIEESVDSVGSFIEAVGD